MENSKEKNIKFAVMVGGQFIGQLVRAKDFKDLLNKMTKKQNEFWSIIEFRDAKKRTITIDRTFLDNDRMTFMEIVEDHIQFGDLDSEIIVLNPNGSGTINL